MTYQYQVFISYNSQDRDWAEQFHLRLKKDNVTCFWDKASLRAGDDWENVILKELQASQHILVLMSEAAKEKSSWVNRELMRFDATINPAKNGSNRRIMLVMLDADDTSLNRFQKIKDLKDAKLYPGKVEDAIKTPHWNAVINQIEDAVNFDPNTIAVPVAVLALTQKRFKDLYKINFDGFADSVNKLLQSIGIDHNNAARIQAFEERYGEKSADWKPFGGSEKINQILDTVRLQINQHIPLGGRKIRWQWIGEKFYAGDSNDASQELQSISKDDPCLFIVDPVSLYDKGMVTKLWDLEQYFEDDKTAVLVLTPVILGYHPELMQLLKKTASPFYKRFYESEVRKRYAHCGINVCDQEGIGRLLRATIGPRIYVPFNDSQVYFDTGGGKQ
jgi:hypothetical protein